MDIINKTLEERGRLVQQMRELSAANPDGFSAEDKAKYEKLDAAQNAAKEKADRLTKESELAAELDAPISNGTRLPMQEVEKPTKFVNTKEYKSAMNTYLRTGKITNALQVTTPSPDTGGGYLTHDDFDQRLREIRDDYNALRPFVDVITTTGDHNIRVESTLGASTWTTETGAYTESDPYFTNVTLNAHKLGRIVKVTEELLQDSDFDLEGYLARNFGRSQGLAEEEAFINGTGTNQPTGILSGAGAVTRTESPLVATVSATTLLDVYYGLNRVYRDQAIWLFSDSSVRDIRGITDQNDNFIWQPGLQAGQPDRVLGRPYVTSAYMPDAGESPLDSPVVFGDMMNYTVADRTGFRIQRLNELYAANGYVAFRGWSRVDAKVVQAAGIKKVAAF